MRKKNLIVLIIVLALIAAVAAAALLIPANTPAPPADTELTAAGYVYITAGQEGRWFELPEEESSITIRRTMEDGTEKINVIQFTPDSVCMHSSTCDNQDCVEQGIVSLTNKSERVLQNLIVCLPNEVSIELFSREEMAQMLEAAE